MGTGDMSESLETKARKAVIDELERQAAEKPETLSVRRDGDRVEIDGEVDIDSLVMVVVGAAAGGP